MTRLSLFNSPFLLGFDQFERTVDRISKLSSDSYPPYNIEQISTNLLRITIAVAGFDKTDLAINLIENTNRNLALIIPSYDKRAEEFVSICIEIMSGQVFESIFETKQNYQCVHDSLMKRYGTSDIANLKSIFSKMKEKP